MAKTRLFLQTAADEYGLEQDALPYIAEHVDDAELIDMFCPVFDFDPDYDLE